MSAERTPPAKQDPELVEECLNGDRDAWVALIRKYTSLIFSIPIKYGLSQDDASDIYQSVCLTLLVELPRIREPRALSAWLIQTTLHQCSRWRNEHGRYSQMEVSEEDPLGKAPKTPEQILIEAEQEQILREALSDLSSTCQYLFQHLFSQSDPVSYDMAAHSLGLAKGSIGATRIRCLRKLRRLLEEKGLPDMYRRQS